MDNKSSMSRVERLRREKVTRYSIRKYSFGAASVAVAALFMFLGNGAVSANELSKQDTPDVEALAPALDAPSTPAESVPAAQPVVEEPAKPAAPEVTTPALDKTKLENYISEVKSKLSAGKYANKTEESLALLNGELASAESTLASATSQDELNVAYRNLVTTVSSKLKNKPKDSKDAPKVDTTNGQPTVGKKAENTEPKAGTNSIENTGSHDSRNEKEMVTGVGFRTEGNQAPTVELPYSNEDKRQIYIYTGENTDLTFTGKDETIVKDLYLRNKGLDESDNASVYGFTIGKVTNSAVASGEGTVSADKRTATIKMTGVTNLKAPNKWTSFIEAKDNDGVKSMPANESYSVENYELRRRKPGYVEFIVKSQTDKYDIKTPTEKVAVTDPTNVTEDELAKIKEKLKIEYSNNNDDANLADKKGTEVENQSDRIASITNSGNNIVVTYKDGSIDTISKGKLISGPAPVVTGNPKARNTILSTDEELSGTGTAGATVKVTIKNPEGTEVISEKTTQVGADGTWKLSLDKGLNSNEALLGASTAARTFYAPKNIVEVIQTTNGIDSEKTDVVVSIGPSKILPSAAAKDGKSVVAGAKEVTFTVPHDAGFTYFFYTNKETNREIQLDIKREDDGSLVMAGGNAGKATVKETVKGNFYDTVTLTLTEPVKEGVNLKVIPHNGGATKGTYLGKTSYPVTNEAPVVAPVIENQNEKTVPTETTITKADLLALVKVTDHEDDQNATLGEKGRPRIVSINGDTNVTTVDTSEAGEYNIVYKVSDSQGKESADYTYKLIVRKNEAPEVTIPYSTTENGKKDIYIYANEDIDIDIKYTDDLGKIKSATVNRGGNQPLSPTAANPNVLDNEYDMTLTPLTAETEATAENPAIVKISGKVTKDTAGLKADKFPKGDNDEYRLVTRYATAIDTDGKEIHNVAKGSSYATDPGSFSIVLKSQTKKYDIRELADADKTVVTDIANIPQAELDKIKENIPLEYSKKNEDKNLEAKKGTAVEKADAAKVVDTVVQKGENLEVTYKDGSKDTIPVDKVVKLDKQPAIDAVTNKATDQIAAINGNDNLTQAEKDKAIAKVNEDKQAALDKIDDATNKAVIDTAKEEGTVAVAKVNPVAKEAAKQAVTDALKAKNAALDEREDLTQKEKEDAKAAAKVEADKAIAKINEQPDTAPTPAEATTAQTAVDTGKTDGTTAIGKINPIGKQAALDKIDEALKAKEKEIDARTDLTDEEKKEVKDRAKEIADTKKEEINAKKNNADTEAEAGTIQGEINTVGTDGAAAITALAKDPAKKPEANTAVTNAAEAKKQSIQDDTALSPEAKKKLQDEVDEIKKASEEAINGAKKNADVDKAKKAGEQAIKAINSARLPGNKLVAKNPTNLDADEQAKLQKAIEAVNPGATVTVNQDGSASVTLPNGKTETLKQVDLTKDASALETTGGGNNINRPTDKVIVNNPDELTPEDKEKIKKAVRDVNPNAVVSIDAAGTVTVSTPDGHTAGFPAKELVRTLADAGKDGSGNAGILKPADKVVGNATNPADQEKATAKLKKLNGADATVKYDAEGNATVVLKDGTIATIPAADLFKTPEDANKVNGGDDINKPNAQTVVADVATLSPEERTKVKDAIKAKVEAVNPGAVVVVDDKGNAIVTTPEGKTAVIDADDLIKKPNETSTAKAGNNINNPADRVQVADKAELTEPELGRIKAAVEAVNPDATVVVDDNGNATVTTKDGKTATIPVADLVKSDADKDNVTGGNQVNTPADRVVVENPAALTEDDKNAIKSKIQAVNPGADVVFDANGNATVTTPAAPGEQPKTATIPASDLVKAKADLADPAKQDAVNKPADKVVVDPALEAANKDLPTEAKDAIKAAVEAVNPGSTVVVDDKGNATVTTPGGKTVVIPKADLVKKEADKETAKAGNNINKPADKVVADKDALIPENIAAIKDKVKAVNPGATVVVDDKGNATVITPEGQAATIPVTDLVKSPEEAKDAKAGNNVNKPADKVSANKDALTPKDIKAIKAKVEAVNPDAKVFIDDKGNATVSTPDGKTATIPVEDLVKDPAAKDEVNGGNKVNTPATKVVVTDPANIKADEDKIKAEILKVNPGATVAFDTEGNATVTTKDGAVATIPASDLAKDAADLTKPDKQDAVKKPADKTLVKKAGKLTQAEKDAIKAAVEKVNPSADPTKPTTVVVDDKGNAIVTTPDGKTEVIPASDLVKTAKEAEGANAGNNINKPADKVSATPADLTGDKKDEVKDKIKAAVEAVNPGATVFVDDKGNATVTKDGKTATIPVEDLLKAPGAKETATAGNKVNTPAERTVVANPAELTDAEKAKITAAIQAVNPEGTKVVFDEAGNATVTVPNEDGTTATATIPVSDLVKSNAEKDLLDPAKQNPVKKPIDQTVVADKDALTPTDKEKIAAKVKEVNPGSTVFVDDKGNATVTTTDGKTAVIAADDLVKTDDEVLSDPKAGNVINKPADGVFVKDGQITDDVKAKIAAKVQRVNPGSTVFVDENGNATVTTPEGKTATIPVADLTKTDADKAKVNAGNKINSPADRVLVKDRDKLTADEIQEIEKNILEVNPGATVVFDAKGNATVKNANGDIATIPVEALAKPKADLLKPEKQDLIKKPVDKVLVTDPANVDKEAIKKAVEEVNPGSTVVVDDNGNATITTEDGRSFVIPAKDLVKTAEEAKNAKAGNNINKPADKVVVADPTKPLSPEEKKAIEAKIKAVNPDAKAIFVDDKGNATVTVIDKNGNTETATIPAKDLVTTQEEAKQPNAGNKVNTPADKVVVSNPDALTDVDKAKITDAIKAVNPEANVVFDDKGNATVTTKDGDIATIPVADLVKSKEEAAKPNAGNNVNTPADKVAVDSSKPLTQDEKDAIAAKVAEVNPGATIAIDDKGNATVTTKDGKTAVIPASALTKTADSAKEPNAGNDVVKPADKTVVENPESLTTDEQNVIAAKVAEVNPEAKTVVVDDKGNATVTTKDGKTVVIPAKDLVKTKEEAAKPNAGNDVNTPADKTVVANPNALTPEEKKAIEEKVKAVNPGAEVVVDNKGNATVTKDGKVAVIPAADLTKTADSAKEPNAGNDVVKPADKTVVANPDSLTQDEKEAIVAKVKAVNPDATVVVDDQGNATVTPKDGKPVVIPASDLTKTAADAAKPNAGNDIVKPADKTVVANPESLTKDEKDAIVAKVKAVNPGAEVVVDDQGNATVTVNGKTAVIPAADLTKNADAEKAPKAGNDIVKPASKTKVANPDSLTQDEKDAIAAKVAAVNPGSTVVVDDQGNATVTLPNGNTAVIPASDLTKSEKDANAKDNAVTPASKTKVANPEKLTDAEKKAIEDKVKAANPGATVVVDDKGNATVVKDGNVSVIPSTDLVKVEDDATKPNGGNDANTPAAKTVVADPTKLTDEEKAAVKKAVAAVNPGSTVVVDDQGNATVTKDDGTVLNIPASDLVIPAEKLADEAKNAKVKTPAIRTLVGNKENLTKDEKDAVKKSIEAVNPGATVVVDDKGNATVTMPDGSTATIAKEQLVKDKEDAKAKNGGDNLEFDFSKVTVTDLKNITPEEKAKFQFMILGAITGVEEFDISTLEKSTDDKGNTVYASKDGKVKITIDKDGNATIEKDGKKELAVTIDKEGNVTIVTKEGQVLAIPRDDAFRQKETPKLPEKVGVVNKTNLTDEEKAAVKEALIKENPKLKDANITISATGEATIVYPDGQKVVIPADKLVEEKLSDSNGNAELDINLPEKVAVGDVNNLTDAEKAAVKEALIKANPKLKDAKITISAKGEATIVYPDGKVVVIPAANLVVAKGANNNAGAGVKATDADSKDVNVKAAANANQEETTNARTVAKELPNTGTKESTLAMVAAAVSALLGLGLAGRRRKEDEEA